MLRMAGRICMIKSVLNSMPKGACRLPTSIQRRFLWAGIDKQGKICKVQWCTTTREKTCGGSGIGSLLGKNKTILFKWL
jgi:hypothetical protein